MDDESYLTAKEVQAHLKISRATLYKLRQQGLPVVKLERKVLFRKSDIDRFLAAKVTISPKVHV